MPLNEITIYVFKQGKKDYPKVFGQLTKRDGAFLVGRNFEPNFDWSNLANKEIIMGRPGGMPAMTLQYVLNQHGYTDGQNITMNYSVAFNMLAPTFASGTGDYVTLFEPTATQVQKEGSGYIVASIGAAGGEVPYTCFVATQSYIKNNKNKLKKFLQCVHDATMYLLSHDNTTVAELLLPYFTGSTVTDIANALANYRANDTWKTTPSMTEADFNRLQDIMTNAGELDGRVQFGDLIDNSIADLITL
jgi:NitT/TauT family transport system substrate-binding protein